MLCYHRSGGLHDQPWPRNKDASKEDLKLCRFHLGGDSRDQIQNLQTLRDSIDHE